MKKAMKSDKLSSNLVTTMHVGGNSRVPQLSMSECKTAMSTPERVDATPDPNFCPMENSFSAASKTTHTAATETFQDFSPVQLYPNKDTLPVTIFRAEHFDNDDLRIDSSDENFNGRNETIYGSVHANNFIK